jgi:serine/threonine protein kinase
MEYCYTDLREVIDEKEVWRKPNEIKRLLREILEALAYIHERRMIHRDLKVNVLVLCLRSFFSFFSFFPFPLTSFSIVSIFDFLSFFVCVCLACEYLSRWRWKYQVR